MIHDAFGGAMEGSIWALKELVALGLAFDGVELYGIKD